MPNSYSNPTELRGWAAILWRMQQYMGATVWKLPIFHTEEQRIHGRRYQWKAWVTLIPLACMHDVECRFVGYHVRGKDAIQDAARLVVQHLRHHYDEEFKDSEF